VNKTAKLVLGAATIWPLVYMLCFMGFIMSMFFVFSQDAATQAGSPHATGPGPVAVNWFFGLFAAHMLTMLVTLGLMIFYIVDVFGNTRFPRDQRVLWLLVILLGGPIGMPIYWYLNIWRDPVASPQHPIEQS
jgi:hypothetical protein